MCSMKHLMWKRASRVGRHTLKISNGRSRVFTMACGMNMSTTRLSLYVFRAVMCGLMYGMEAESWGQLLAVVLWQGLYTVYFIWSDPYLSNVSNDAVSVSNLALVAIFLLQTVSQSVYRTEAVSWSIVAVCLSTLGFQHCVVAYSVHAFLKKKFDVSRKASPPPVKLQDQSDDAR